MSHPVISTKNLTCNLERNKIKKAVKD